MNLAEHWPGHKREGLYTSPCQSLTSLCQCPAHLFCSSDPQSRTLDWNKDDTSYHTSYYVIMWRERERERERKRERERERQTGRKPIHARVIISLKIHKTRLLEV